MTEQKSTKRALLSSVLAMLLCVAMLIGATFAWFTDTASTAVNKIQSGNLDVQLFYADNATGENANWTEVTADTKLNFLQKQADGSVKQGTDILWEPGCTYSLPALKVVNNGNLALKYKIVITGIDGDAKLNEVIDWTMKLDNTDFTMGSEHSLAAKTAAATDADIFTISGTMQTTADNTYQNRSIDGVKITVYATQDTVEYDSNSNRYDKDAKYPTYPAGLTADSFEPGKTAVDGKGVFYNSFKDALANVDDNGEVYLKENSTVSFPTHLDVTKNITIYGNGSDFSGKDLSIGTYQAPENAETTVNIYNAKNLVVWGQPEGNRAYVWNVNIYNCTNDNYNFLMYRGSETGKAKLNLTLTNCSASGFADSIVHTTADGNITIKNCTFKNNCAPVNIAHKQTGALKVSVENSKFVNCGKVDAANDYFAPARFVNNSETGSLNVTLKNNTFTGTIGTNGDILLGDYRPGKASHKVTANIETTNPVMVKSSTAAAYSYAGGTIVIPAVEAASQEELKSALQNGEVGSVKLSSGVYTLYNVANSKTQNTTLAITGAGPEETTFSVGKSVTESGSEHQADYSYDNSEVTFKNLTIKMSAANYMGFIRAKSLYFENCAFEGRGSYWGVGKVTFKNCTFNDNPGDYNLWLYSGTDFTFNGCTFNSTAGKFINAYKEQKVDSTLDFIDCNFHYTGTGTASKPAVCLKSYQNVIWKVSFKSCVSTGCTDSGTGSKFYSIENGMNADTTVSVDGTVLWENGAKK